MRFSDLSELPFVHLYAGDLPDAPEYRDGQKIGLSLTQDDQWHIRHDVTVPLPIADESVDTYQSEDVFEHIAYEALFAIILEVRRVLKKNGLFRLSLPDYRCDVLSERTLRDAKGNFVFDPFGGGAYKGKFPFFWRKKVIDGGHVWFPAYETVRALFEKSPFSSVKFLHYHDQFGISHTHAIDYRKGFIQRTPDHDKRAASPFRALSLVVDCIK